MIWAEKIVLLKINNVPQNFYRVFLFNEYASVTLNKDLLLIDIIPEKFLGTLNLFSNKYEYAHFV